MQAPCQQPFVGKQIIELMVRMGVDACEQVAKIGKRLDAETLAAGDQSAQHGSGSPTFVASVEKPVPAN